MTALLLCELPVGSSDARSWILGQVTLLASRAEASLRFAAIEEDRPGEPSREILAIEVASIDLADALRSAWRSDKRLSNIDVRLLRIEAARLAEFSAALFP